MANKNQKMNREQRARRRRLLREQKIIGAAILAVCVALTVLCWGGMMGGESPANQDCTAVILLAPLGIWMMTTRKVVIV